MVSRLAAVAFCLALLPGIASAGWVSEWENTAIHNGERLDPERSTVKLEKNRMRIDQPQIVSIFDYGKGTMTLINPQSAVYWSGSVDEYSQQTAARRNESLRRRIGDDVKVTDDNLKVDLSDLPEIKVERTDEAKTIAGRDTVKYVVLVNDELFQEIWMTEDINTSADLDVAKFLDYQRRNSLRMIGNSAKPFNALYRSKAYEDFLKKGTPLQTIVHHLAGGFERRALSFKQADVPDSEFAVPASYRKVRIVDVFPKQPES